MPRAGHSLEKNKFSAKKSRIGEAIVGRRGINSLELLVPSERAAIDQTSLPPKRISPLPPIESVASGKQRGERAPIILGMVDRWRGHMNTCDGALFVSLLSMAFISLPGTQWVCLTHIILNVIIKDLSEWFLRRISHQGPCMFDHQTPLCSATAATAR